MKRWLALSLVLNLGLLIVVFSRSGHTEKPAGGETHAAPGIEPRQTAISQALQTVPISPTKPQDLNSWLETLRSAGVPNKIIANVVIADFENRWETKERELQQKFETGEVDADALTQAESERVAAREQALRTALGDAGYHQWDKENTLRDMNLGSVKLSDAESDSLYELRKNLLQGQRDLEQAAHEGKIDETELSQKLSALQTQCETQTHALLGDNRFAAMNNSPDVVSADLRRKTKDLNPTADQLGELTAAQKQWNDQRANLDRQLESGQLSPDQHDAQMQSLDAARDQAYQRALGTNGFVAFQKSQDPNYQAMKQYSTAWQLTDSDIDYLYQTIQASKASISSYQQQAQALQSQGRPVDWSSVQKSISQYSNQVGQTLQNYLGDERFKKLQQNNVLTLGN
jgi:hypothetical protein